MRRLIVEEPLSRAAVWSRRTAVFALATAGVSIALSRLGHADPAAVLTVFGAALVLAFLAVLLACSAAVVIWRTGRRGADQAGLAFVLSLALLTDPAYLTVAALRLPALGDISTDLEAPPSFMISTKAREARAGRPAPVWNPALAPLQRAAYPEVQPVLVDLEADQAYQLSLRIAKELGWQVIDANPPNLRVDGAAQIEATARSLVFGFVDDIVIRIRPLATQTRIDLRSTSRVGRHDFGANARRIDKFAAAVQESMTER
ncbi:MAG: DUF1499 domain-containing protein [Hyphomicrobiales bacterium]|nr:DUF1499 domain-containing protein [Hyphomicrobiales bacterium]